jgi:hypothetical protein
MNATVDVTRPGYGRVTISGLWGELLHGSIEVPLDSHDPWTRRIVAHACGGDRQLVRDAYREIHRASVADLVRREVSP